ncbi:MAG: hypothetical protein K940chlam6_00990 [Chlamydiae bacterium]|nr:hypothetical protein [Chlamydiota bacterium]
MQEIFQRSRLEFLAEHSYGRYVRRYFNPVDIDIFPNFFPLALNNQQFWATFGNMKKVLNLLIL